MVKKLVYGRDYFLFLKILTGYLQRHVECATEYKYEPQGSEMGSH